MFKRYWFLLIVLAALMQVGCGDEGDKKKKGSAGSGSPGSQSGEGFAAKPEKGPGQYTAAPLIPPDIPPAGQQGTGNAAAAPATNPDASTNAQPANGGGQAAAGNAIGLNPNARAAKAPPKNSIKLAGGQTIVLRSDLAVGGADLDSARPGENKRGQGYGGGIITEPVRQYFLNEERIALQIQYPKAIKEYRAFHDNKNPPSLEAFYNDILVPYEIPLPELREGEFYVYDPKGKEPEDMLLVARPQQQ
jgi:hypothetical protein